MINVLTFLFSSSSEESSVSKVSQTSRKSAAVSKQSPAILEYADIKFEVEGRTVEANKALLCMVSPVFKTMFEGNFKEAGLPTIPLPQKSYYDFVEFIEVTHLHKNITFKNVKNILPIADEYNCDRLMKKCEAVLLTEPGTLKLYKIALTYSFKELRAKSLKDLQSKSYFKEKAIYWETYKSLEDREKIDYLEKMLESVKPLERTVWPCSF